MTLRATLVLPLVALLSLVTSVSADSKTNIAVYWGQNSYGQASSQQRLSVYCANSKINITPLAFMNGIKTPITNFANAGDNCTVYAGTQLLNCPQIEEDIKTCQSNGKTILLSLGGATYTEGGFSSPSDAEAAATNIWNLFGPSTGTANRPFRSAVIDGFDFDFESSTSNMRPFAAKLRSLMDSASGKRYYLSAAPQCPYPDVADNDILVNVALDFVFVQFYNNYCGVSSYRPGDATQNNYNFGTWDNWAKQTSINKDVKVLIGIPANTGAGGGYVPASTLASVIAYSKQFSSFGGIMMWDMSQLYANSGFLDGVYSALTSGGGTSPPSPTNTPPPGTTLTTRTMRRSVPVANVSSGCTAVVSTVTATVTVTAGRGDMPATTVYVTKKAVQTTPEPTPTGGTLVDQWGQCGGQGYTGPTQCKPPYTCVKGGDWWSDCR
ncbi:chitinase [Apiospora phragmitis]|uniref:chitinase n=1 Tax=Apiospora phragmitis TaxID=2905665 RepID=A0ABR1WQX5_9PEZI